MRKKRAICQLICFILLIFFSDSISAQQPVKLFKVKDNTMYIFLSRDLSVASIDSFIQKYNLKDIGLMRFMQKGLDDSLTLMGWEVLKDKPDVIKIAKPLEQAGQLLKEDYRIFSPVPTPEDWRVVGGNKIIYGHNDFKDNFSFKREDDVIQFELPNHFSAKKVRLAGNFTNWQHEAFPMTKTNNGWVVSVKLIPGKYYYKFIVNEHDWITDPNNNITENDGKGNENSVYFVTNKVFELKGYTDAHKVSVAGSFNNWVENKLPLTRTADGWRTDIYLEPGTHNYHFVVDGKIIGENKKESLAIGSAHEFLLKGFTDAKKVIVAGNFNDWKEDELLMEKTADCWKLSYVLGPGNYQYKFIVDGNWMVDPQNPAVINDGKGNQNSFLVIGANYTFELKNYANAREVYLAGDFNEWSPVGTPLKKEAGLWVCSIYLAPGKHLYKFIVDGKWIRDPDNPNWDENEMGSGNSIIWIEKSQATEAARPIYKL